MRFEVRGHSNLRLPVIGEVALLVYDFDGVMTDNRALVDENGNESVFVNRSDGLAIAELRRLGVPQFILSTEANPVVLRRAEKLRIPCIHNCGDKRTALADYLMQNNIDPEKVVYCGNDINDLEVMRFVGLPVSPADGHWRVKEVAKYVTRAKGGEGVIRELYDLLVQPAGETPKHLVAA